MPAAVDLENIPGALVQIGQATFGDLIAVTRLFLAVVEELNSTTPLQGLLKHG